MRRAAVLAALGLGLATPALPQGGAAGLEGFRAAALQADAFEIESSRLALERSRNPAIRAHARRMIQDHARGTQALLSLPRAAPPGPLEGAASALLGAVTGGAATAPGPVVLNARQTDMLGQLAPESGPAFDALYTQMQVTAHQEAVGLYAAYAQGGSDPAGRALAQQTLPTLQDHLRAAQRLAAGRAHGPTR
jgi:putative membrane protein